MPAQIRGADPDHDKIWPRGPIAGLGRTAMLAVVLAVAVSRAGACGGSAVRREPAARGRGPGRVLDPRTLCRGRQADGHDRPDVRAVSNSQAQDASLPRGDDPRRRTDRVEFPRHAGRAARLGRRLRRQRLCRLRRRSVGARSFGIFRRQLRQDAQALGRERGAALHRPRAQAALAAGRPAHAMAGNGHAGRCGIRRLLRQPGRDHRRRGADRADEPRSRRQAARSHRARGFADALAGRRDRLEHCGRAAAAGERHSGDRAQWPAHPRDRRKGCAGLFRRRRGRTSLGRHPREDHLRSAGADAGRPQARAAGAGRRVPGSCVAFCRPSRRGRCRTCVGFPSSSW